MLYLCMAQQFLDRCFKRRYISEKLDIGELLKVQDHRICRKVFSIPNYPRRANFPETKTIRYNLRNKSPVMPAIYTDRQKIFSLPRVVPCFPLLGLTSSGLFMGLSSTIIYTSELILCSTICVPSATLHNIRFKNTFFNRIVFKYNVALQIVYFLYLTFGFISIYIFILFRGKLT